MTVLAVIVSVEAVLVLLATVLAVGQFFGHGAKVEADGAAYLVCLAIGCLWVGVAAVGLWFAQPWVRGLVITWQLVQLAVGVGAMQGLLAGPLVGILLLVLGLAGIGLVFTPAVTRSLARTPSE
ncbi:MAG TPA: hypothetical protein VGC45_04760 [Gryllotalpicola sp.]